MRYALFFLLAALAAGCASSTRTADSAGVPRRATDVVVTSDLPPDALYAEAYQALSQAGLRFMVENDRLRILSTERRMVGASGTIIRLNVAVEPAGTGSRLQAVADYRVENAWFAATNRPDRPTARVAFEELVTLLRPVPGAVSYKVDELRARPEHFRSSPEWWVERGPRGG
jgi:hypothetical protein